MGEKKIVDVDTTEDFDNIFVNDGKKLKQTEKTRLKEILGMNIANGIIFKGEDTTSNILAKSYPSVGDKWYSTDENVYYMYSQNGWINVGSGEDYYQIKEQLRLLSEESTELKNDLVNIELETDLLNNSVFSFKESSVTLAPWTTEGWYGSDGKKYTTSGYVNSKNAISPFRKYSLHYFSYYSSTYAILDINGNILSVGESADSLGESTHSKWIDATITIPYNGAFIALSSGNSGTEILNRETTTIKRIDIDIDKILNNSNNIEALKEAVIGLFKKSINFDTIQNSVILKSSGKPYTASSLSGFNVSDYIEVNANKAYRVKASSQYGGNILYAIYDADKNVIVRGKEATSSVTVMDDVVIIPTNGKYIIVSGMIGNEAYIYDLAEEKEFAPVEYEFEVKKCLTTAWTISDSGTFEFYLAKTPVVGGSKVRLTSTTNWGNPHYGFARADGTVISLVKAGSGIQTLTNEIIDVPTNATHILVNQYAKYPIKIETLQESKTLKWKDKKWIVIGDSLTDLNGRAYIHYYDFISWITGIDIINMGVSDTGYAKGTNNNAFYQRLDGIDTSADVITIFGSFNDLASGKSIGNITDTGTGTICGCINTTIDTIYDKIPLANLGIVAPCPWSQYTPMDSDTSACVQYVNALENIAKYRGIPYLDLFRTSGIRPWESSIRDVLYTQDEGGGTHPNAKGHKILSAKFEGFLNSLLLN